MLRKARNYAQTMARWYKAGKPLADKKVVVERLEICRICDSLIKDWECSECGCPMMEKAKMGIVFMHKYIFIEVINGTEFQCGISFVIRENESCVEESTLVFGLESVIDQFECKRKDLLGE